MPTYLRALTAIAAVAAALVALPDVSAQTGSGSASNRWRTQWGAPDLQGMWTFVDEVMTPFEKPDCAAGTRSDVCVDGKIELLETVKDAEAALLRRRGGTENPGNDEHWSELRPVPTLKWLVREPDGRVPPRTPSAQERAQYLRERHFDSYEYMNPQERCISKGVPGAIMPAGFTYNHSVQIMQTRQHVVFRFEMFDTWIVPVDGRPHLRKDIRSWNGDPRGRWDGDTLVIDVTNFNGQARPLNQFLGSEALHVVMRLKRMNDNTIDMEATVDDAAVFAKPWKVGLPLKRDPVYRQFEYACHEGNLRAMINTLAGARAEEREGAATETQKQGE